MRNIKFRVWDIENKCYTKEEFVEYSLGMIIKEKDDFIVEQFTGLQDKNGTDIYEGDKVKFIHESNYCNDKALCEEDWNYGTIVWGDNYPAFDVDNHSEDYNLLSSPEYIIEVIGNIHEES